jgi:hypothetical protein
MPIGPRFGAAPPPATRSLAALMNAQNPRPRFGPTSPLIFCAPNLVAPGDGTPIMSQVELPPPILDVRRAEEVVAFGVDPGTHESVAMPINRNLANQAIAHHQTASRALRQGALKAAVAALQRR